MKNMILLLILFSGVSFSETFLMVGGGYPYGIIRNLNNACESAYETTNNLFGKSYGGSLTKTQGGTFAVSFGMRLLDSIASSSAGVGLVLGYSYHGTGEAGYSNIFSIDNQRITLSSKSKYAMHEIKLVPMILTANSENAMLGIGAGAEYDFVKYTQKNTNTAPNTSFELPDLNLNSSGFTWILQAFLKYKYLGIEASTSGMNVFYIGAILYVTLS